MFLHHRKRFDNLDIKQPALGHFSATDYQNRDYKQLLSGSYILTLLSRLIAVFFSLNIKMLAHPP